MPTTARAASAPLTEPPAYDEYAEYYRRYVDAVPAGDLLVTLERQLEEMVTLLDTFGEARAGHRYGPGKWSVKEVVGHVVDAERIFTMRALCAARGETAPLPSFDENAYVAHSNADARTLNALMGELTAVRRATLALFRSLDETALARRVTASGYPVTARALAWITAGHDRHHARILRERYG
jgi:uncharacterized damage-inducible protein DinB